MKTSYWTAFFLSTLDYSRPSDHVKGHTEAPWVQTLRLWGTSESLGPFTNKKKVKPSLLSAYKSTATAQNVMRARAEAREPANTLAATSWAKSKEKKKKKSPLSTLSTLEPLNAAKVFQIAGEGKRVKPVHCKILAVQDIRAYLRT